ncbi:MAG: crossover junction endodeoxyribonuclease RuvC [Candidatus Paceibacterota bacterium]
MRILSIDPGYQKVGIAIIEKNKGQKENLIYSDCFKTSAEIPHYERIKKIGEEIKSVIKKHKPEALSIETLFFNTNQKTSTKVSEARGVIIYEASVADLSIHEYTPLQIKIAVTGYGRGDKKQVISLVHRLINIDKKIKEDDEYDAIACGLTFFAYNKNP